MFKQRVRQLGDREDENEIEEELDIGHRRVGMTLACSKQIAAAHKGPSLVA